MSIGNRSVAADRPLQPLARGLLLSAFMLLLVVGCGSSRRSCSTTVVLRAIPEQGQQVTATGMQTAQEIIENRLSKLGVSSPTVAVHGDEIVIQTLGSHDPTEAAQIVGTTGRLQMFDFEPSLAAPTVTGNQQPAPKSTLYSLLTAVKPEAGKGSPESYYLFNSAHSVLQGPAATRHQLLLPYKDGARPPHTHVLEVPANREPVLCSAGNGCPGAGSNGRSKDGKYWYLFKYFPTSAQHPNGPPELTGRDFVESGIAADVDPNTGQPIVTLQFTNHGLKEFKRITEAEYNRGRVNAGQAGRLHTTDQNTIAAYSGHTAIVLDGQLEETPYIDYTDPTLSQGIVGNAQVTEPSTRAARRTALVLQSGSLPYRFRQVKLSRCAR